MKHLPLIDFIGSAYAKGDALITEHPSFHEVTCKDGCSSCCRLLTAITPLEGVALAHAVMQDPSWKTILPRLRAAAEEVCVDGLTRKSYFMRKVACPLLDGDRCSVYDARPIPCRYHLVVSEPDRCSPDNVDATTVALDTGDMETQMQAMMLEQSVVAGFPPGSIAPIALTVLWCLLTLADEADRRDVHVYVSDLPTPAKWVEKYGASLIDEGDGVIERTSDQNWRDVDARVRQTR